MNEELVKQIVPIGVESNTFSTINTFAHLDRVSINSNTSTLLNGYQCLKMETNPNEGLYYTL